MLGSLFFLAEKRICAYNIDKYSEIDREGKDVEMWSFHTVKVKDNSRRMFDLCMRRRWTIPIMSSIAPAEPPEES